MNPIPVFHCLSLDIKVKLDVDIEIEHLNTIMDIGQSWKILFNEVCSQVLPFQRAEEKNHYLNPFL